MCGEPTLDVVLVGEDDRPQLLAYLQRRLADGKADAPRLPVRRAHSVGLRVDGGRPAGHVDDEVVAGLAANEQLELELVAGAISVLIPTAG